MFENEERQEAEFAPVQEDQLDDIGDVLGFEAETPEIDPELAEPEEEEVEAEEAEEIEEEDSEEFEEEAETEDGEPVEAEAEEPPVEAPPEPPAELQALKDQIAALQGTITELTKPAQPEEPPPQEAPKMDFSEVFKDLDFDAVVDTKEGFVEFMSNVLNTMHQQTMQTVQTSVPQTVQQTVAQQEVMHKVRDAFYTDYPELAEVKGYVGQVASEIKAANPQMELQEVLVETAKVTKDRLGIKAVEAPKEKVPKPKKKASLPGTKTTRTKSAKRSEQQSDIDQLLDF